MNKVWTEAIRRLDPSARRALFDSLKQDRSASAVHAIAEMLQFSSTCELAMMDLAERAKKYPKPAIRAMAFAMYGNDAAFRFGIMALGRIVDTLDPEIVNDALQTVADHPVGDEYDRWRNHVKAIKSALTKQKKAKTT